LDNDRLNFLKARQEVCIRGKHGLHARPAACLAQEAQKFQSNVRLIMGDQVVDCKNILDILTLAAGQGCGLEIEAEGEDAPLAVEHLAKFIEKDCS